ncbi:hypothetical protein ALQ94_101190 [Pseudomonas amygdali pv. morsprunorum]|uniref:Uncharacterized protein n=1 Tax=Pseudomonas amygdali pv. morsprunorum TaxID=129138 RepID=A0A3M2WQH0_PSEA0|nr:hypothetical protein ALQ94_101190 [Pseudomonas amygdali pv. morsprunorum]
MAVETASGIRVAPLAQDIILMISAQVMPKALTSPKVG